MSDIILTDPNAAPEAAPGEQQAFFKSEPEWTDMWQGMPEYAHQDLMPDRTLMVHFRNKEDCQAFAKFVEQTISEKTKFIWWPKAEIGRAANKMFVTDEPVIPRHPIYIISKGRWETRLTSKALEYIQVPYHIVVEPQEYEQYAAVIDPAKIFTLPFSNLGQGGIPARNWVWEHAVSIGAERHWILDDNISGFCYFTDNLKVEVKSGATFCAIEDFCDRYENVMMAAFNYDYFAPRKQGAKIKPITWNTRCYSGILLRNDLKNTDGTPMRWRGRYNEDTDLSLRILKDGWCTALFNAFLMYKAPTLTMKGGNTEDLYKLNSAEVLATTWASHIAECAVCKKASDGYDSRSMPCEAGQQILSKDGRWMMAEHLRLQHPDCTTVERLWERWQHRVDYRRFRENRLVPKTDAAAPRDYGMKLEKLTDEQVEEEYRAFSQQPVGTPAPKPEVKQPVSRPKPATQPIQTSSVASISISRQIPELEQAGGSLFDVEVATETRPASTWVASEPLSLDRVTELAFDTETTGLKWRDGDLPIGISIYLPDGRAQYLPFGHRGGGNLSEETVKRWAERELRGKRLIGANIKFDVHQMRAWGVDLEAQGCTVSDVQHYAALLDDHRKKFNLEVLSQDYLKRGKVGGLDKSRMADYAAGDVADYAIEDAELVWDLKNVMYPLMDAEDLQRVRQLEDEVIFPVCEMERNGSPIYEALLQQYGEECTAAHLALVIEVSREAGFAFEHTAKGWTRLLEALHLPVPDSFAESELALIDHPLVRKGQRAAQYASLNSKIFKAYPEHIVDGRLRYEIKQLASDDGGTVSGRFSIGLVQQVPNADNHYAAFGDALYPRRLFIPGNGSYLEGDAAQIELRLLTHYSQNAKLLQAYKDDPWVSFHKKMQEMLVVYKPDMNYAHTKAYNFASQYGAKSIKLAIMMGFITERVGDEIRAAKRWDDPRLNLIHEIEAGYKRAHPEAGKLLDFAAHLAKPACDEYCKKDDALHRQHAHRGYVKTLLGRRSRFPTNYKTYIGLNRILQGSGADIMKRKLVELHAIRKETGFVMRITNHDAVLGDATTPETLGRVSEILNAQSYPLRVPILWQCGVGANWAEAK